MVASCLSRTEHRLSSHAGDGGRDTRSDDSARKARGDSYETAEHFEYVCSLIKLYLDKSLLSRSRYEEMEQSTIYIFFEADGWRKGREK